MVSTLATLEQTTRNENNSSALVLDLIGASSTRSNSPVPSVSSPLLLIKPLISSGGLSEFESRVLTPAIGIKFGKGLNLKTVLEEKDLTKRDDIIRELALSGESNNQVDWK
jgi:hypothetical protein